MSGFSNLLRKEGSERKFSSPDNLKAGTFVEALYKTG